MISLDKTYIISVHPYNDVVCVRITGSRNECQINGTPRDRRDPDVDPMPLSGVILTDELQITSFTTIFDVTHNGKVNACLVREGG